MFTIELKNKKSIYEQIVYGYKEMIITGELQPNEKIMSVRELSEKLTVNPNTVQKAYRALEQDGWIYTLTGRGNFVSEDTHTADRVEIEGIYEGIGNFIEELSYLGVANTEIRERLNTLVDERGKKK